jgi:hypothetical protein
MRKTFCQLQYARSGRSMTIDKNNGSLSCVCQFCGDVAWKRKENRTGQALLINASTGTAMDLLSRIRLTYFRNTMANNFPRLANNSVS